MPNDTEAERSRTVEEAQPAFARFMGVRITSASRDRVEAELTVDADFANRNGVLHGGAIMAFADILGGTASVLSCRTAHGRPRSRAKPTSSGRSRWARPPVLRACPCTGDEPRWYGRRRSRALTAGTPPSSRKPNSSWRREGSDAPQPT